ncbi:serralysin [Peteryoungia aggregata LMG 23059]|uniref:Serralysin n=1 Tax=Peteryoungia aggregata LMG 23059 TaxID=1368425 RepID=A0ABU0G5R7_9HYPH|nr:M10 family metallopeptidase C-terminal domain-containing protein [Peteryoungia aggregata]MDQ0420022.1 serralysin [Peteryoungia aggregata LMG 23059]
MALSSWTDQQVINQLNSGSKWSGSVITYSFPTVVTGMARYSGEGSGFSAFNATQQARAELALTLWDDVIATSIQKVAAGTTSSASNIEFGNSTSGVSYAHAYFPTVGSVWINSAYNSSQGTNDLMTPKIGAHGFLTFVHEIGHALGLEHMGDYNGSADAPSSYQDSTVYSVMSYFGPSWGSGAANGQGLVAWADWVGSDGRLYSPQTPMMNDIMAMQAMYGVDTSTRTGDTVYGFQSNVTGATAAIFDFTQNLNPIICIWDAGGIDTLNLSGWNTASSIDLAPGSFSSANSMTMNISIARGAWIENAVTGNGNDTVQGNARDNVITTNGGNDTIRALEGNDTIAAGNGNDSIDGGAGTDVVIFHDSWSNISWTYSVASATFTFMGVLIGTDTITAVERFVDSLNVERSLESLLDPDLLPALASVAADASSVTEGSGDQTAVTFTVTLSKAALSDETLSWRVAGTGSSAANVQDFSGAQSGTVSFAAGETTKTITVYLAADTAFEANETFALTLSAPSLGLSLATASAAVTIVNDDVQLTPIVMRGGVSSDTLVGTDAMEHLDGGNGNDTLRGGGGNDILVGGAGNDLLDGGTGNDRMVGDAGDDTYLVDSIGDIVTEVRTGNTDTVRTTLQAYTLTAWVENLVYAGAADFSGTGNELANRISGGIGNDVLSGGAGNDSISGGGGNDRVFGGSGNDVLSTGDGDDYLNGGSDIDRMTGGAGNDVYVVDNTRDIVAELANGGIDTVQTTLTSYRLGAHVENLTYLGSSSFVGYGNDLHNVLTGGSGANILDGGRGDDILYGNGGNDVLLGSTGIDTLYGGAGNDRLDGGAGNDWLYGGLGVDTLTGGAGADMFVFDQFGTANSDRITDFDVALDQILIEADVFSDIGYLGTLIEQSFGTGSVATTAEQRILHNRTTGALAYDADGDGAGAAVVFAHVKAGLTLYHDDFAVV